MSTATDFLRRAADGVSSTLAQASTTVTHAAQGRKRFDASDEATEKCTLTIKCTPNKDAKTTTALSIKSGYLMKRNEQGQWQRRYICTVPHLFLYYFDSDSSDFPRGIIDLELYSNISRNKNFLKVAPMNEEKMRSFHFQCDNGDTLNDWQAHFLRDRYFAVCDERNAYQQMQSELTAVLDTIACQTKAVEIDKDLLQKQLEEAVLAKHQAISVLQNVLVIVGITEEESAQLQDLNRIAHCLESHVMKLKRELETKFFGPDEVLEAEKAARKEEVLALQESLELEIRARRNVEAMMLKVRKAAELREQEMQCEIDTLQLNFQALLAAKTESDTKSANLSEQKKLLIKEIKRLRGQLIETETNLDRVSAVNVKLTESATSLQAMMQAGQRALTEQERAAAQAEARYKQREQAAVTAAVVAALDAVTLAGSPRSAERAGEADGGADAISIAGSIAMSDTLPVPAVVSSSCSSGATQEEASTSDEFVSPGLFNETTSDVDAELLIPHGGGDQSAESSSNEEAEVTSTDAATPAVVVAVATLSAEEVHAVLLESQAIMSSLRPLPGGAQTPGKGGSMSAHSSANSLAAVGATRERQNSFESGKSGTSGGMSNNPSTPQDLKDLGWLSPEQERMVSSRLQLQPVPRPEVDPQFKYLVSSNTTAASGAEDANAVLAGVKEETRSSPDQAHDRTEPSEGVSSFAEGFTSSAAASAASAAATRSMSMLSGAMSLLSSTASSMQAGSSSSTSSSSSAPEGGNSTAPAGSSSSSNSGSSKLPKGIVSTMLHADPSGERAMVEADDPERLPSAMRLSCLRCAGTVEGPKHSTCTCSVPALTPEDLQADVGDSSSSGGGGGGGSWGFTGMFSKSSSVLKESLAKASRATADSLKQMSKAAAAASSSSASSGSESRPAAPQANSSGGGTPAYKEGYLFYNTVVSSPSPRTPAAPAVERDTAVVVEMTSAPKEGSGDHTLASTGSNVEDNNLSPEKELWGYISGTKPALSPEPAASEVSAEDEAADCAHDPALNYPAAVEIASSVPPTATTDSSEVVPTVRAEDDVVEKL